MTVLKTYDFDALAEGDETMRTTKTQVVFASSNGGEIRMSKKKASLAYAARSILGDEHPMTVRQVYYRLFSSGWVDNSQASYRQVVGALVDARQYGIVPWEHIEDRVRQPRKVSQWSDLAGFLQAVRKSYRRDVWQDQDAYVEVWLEKDALSGIFSDELRAWGVTLNVGRGYDGWASIQEAAERFKKAEDNDKEVVVLYAGDYDPSGLHMEVSLRERLAYFGVRPTWERLAIDRDDIDQYDLPPEPGKRTDSRAEWMLDNYGELIQVELDALPVQALRDRINDSVERFIDTAAFDQTVDTQEEEETALNEMIDQFGEE